MDDLISRQAAIDKVDRIVKVNHLNPDMVWFTPNGVKTLMEDMPSAEPEIIRCEDCEWWEKQKDSLQGRCELMQMYPTGAWYCGNAQRRVTDG